MKISRQLNIPAIQERLYDLDLSQRAFAEKIGLSTDSVLRWLTGESVPRWTSIIKIAKGLDLKASDIVLNYNNACDIAVLVTEKIFSCIEAVEKNKDLNEMEKITMVSQLLSDHFGKIDLTQFFIAQVQTTQKTDNDKPKMTDKEALDL